MGTYGRYDVVFDRGEGSWLIDTQGERYLDFGSGIAVNALGHANPKLTAALAEQAQKLWHTSNLYRVAGQEKLAERLVAETFCRQGVLLQFGRGGLRRHHQARAALPVRERPSRALAHHHVQGLVPRPHARDDRGCRQREVSRRFRRADARLRRARDGQ
jgi:hypothetical protein